MYLDCFIVIVLLYALWKGWNNGLLRELVSSLGFIAGLVIACLFYGTLGEHLAVGGSKLNMFSSIVAFFLLWIIAPIVLGTVATVVTKALNRLTLISLPNRLAGMGVSVLKYLLFMSLALNVMDSLHILNSDRKDGSHLLEPVSAFTGLLAHSVMDAAAPIVVQNDTVRQNDTIWVEVEHL